MKPVRAESRVLIQENLYKSDRVLVTGAGGWFGMTVAALLHGAEQQVMYITRRPRTIDFMSGTVDAISWDWEAVKSFAPTIVIDCAFILRDYVDDMSFEQYVAINAALTSQMLQIAGLPSVTTIMYVSSGAAIHPMDATMMGLSDNPYGYMKRATELSLSSFARENNKAATILRPWSLSGSLVTRPERYAFSDLITQVVSGNVNIRASHNVLRRYVGVDDFFAVGMGAARRGVTVLNSGGELVEFEELAKIMSEVLGNPIALHRTEPTGEKADDYYSRDSSWGDACLYMNFAPATLAEQIKDVASSLAVRGVTS